MGGKGEGDFFSFFGDLASPPFSTGAGALPWKGGEGGIIIGCGRQEGGKKGPLLLLNHTPNGRPALHEARLLGVEFTDTWEN